MAWINSGRDRDSTMAALPEIAMAFNALYSSFWQQPHIPPETLELCRLRLAQLHNSSVDLEREDCFIPTEKRERLSQWGTDRQFTKGERACLELTEMYAMDVQAITDEQAQALKGHILGALVK